jgi:hypothetical protein
MRQRNLADHEIAYAKRIFDNAIDYRSVRVTRGSALAFFSATALGNTINLQADHFVADTLNLSDGGLLVLIHELAHVWQYQHSGIGYIGSSLGAQFLAWATTGSRRGAYDWRKAQQQKIPWVRWSAEQQAQCFSDYNEALERRNRAELDSEERETITLGGALIAQALGRHAATITGPRTTFG